MPTDLRIASGSAVLAHPRAARANFAVCDAALTLASMPAVTALDLRGGTSPLLVDNLLRARGLALITLLDHGVGRSLKLSVFRVPARCTINVISEPTR